MSRRTKAIIGTVALVGAVVGGTAVAASGSSDDDGFETPITGVEYEKATAAALSFLGEGTVTETEIGDEESLYEVEVTLADGSQVDVQLDESFTVISADPDSESDAG